MTSPGVDKSDCTSTSFAAQSDSRANAHRASFAPIFVSRQPTDLPCPRPYVLYRPILTTQLFSVLERVIGMLAGFDNFLAKPIRREGISELAAELTRPGAAI